MNPGIHANSRGHMNTDNFFVELPIIEDFVEVSNPSIYHHLPDDWHVVVTDIIDSTKAIARGEYKTVNLVGASSIIAMLNLKKSFSLPFVFGGDGASICIPASLVTQARESLQATRLMARELYGFDLRVGIVPLTHIRRHGSDVLVARFRISEHFAQAIFSGGGLEYAEQVLKDPQAGDEFKLENVGGRPQADFSGLECRWQNVPSPHGEVVTLIVQATGATSARKNATYREVIQRIGAIYGADALCRPVRAEDLSATLNERQLSGESNIRSFGKGMWYRILYWFKIRYGVIAGWYLMKFNRTTATTRWGDYKSQLAANTDYKKFDDKLRQVLSGTPDQRTNLEAFLREKLGRHELVFGIHTAPTALVTCLIFSYNDAHVHLVDSDGGGYAAAATMLKKQLKEISV